MSNIETTLNIHEDKFISELFKTELGRLIEPNYWEQIDKPYKIKVGYYLRVSTLNQAKTEKVSLPEQELQIKDFIFQNGWEISKRFTDEGITGKSMEKRDGFLQMIESAKKGEFEVIVGWTTDRLARNVDEMTALRSELRKHNIQITTVKEPTDVVNPKIYSATRDDGIKKVMAYLRDWDAEQDNTKRVLRFEAGKLGKARKGRIPVKVPYGYKKCVTFVNGDPKKKIEEDLIVEEEAVVVKEIFDLYDNTSIGMMKIAEHLNLKGIKSPTGKKWGMSTVKYILQNPTYAGIVRWGWRLSTSKESRTRLQQGHKGLLEKGLHQKIIEVDQFNRVKEKMKLRHTLGGKAVSSKGLLTGLLKCPRCGGGTYFTSYPNWNTYTKAVSEREKYKDTATYFCSNYSHFGKSACSKRYIISADKIEHSVVKKISELANSEGARREYAKQMKKNNSKILAIKISELENKLSTIDDKYQRLKHAYTNGAISLGEFSSDKIIIDQERKSVLTDIESVKVDLLNEERLSQQSESALLALTDFEKSWKKTDIFGQKLLLQALITNITMKYDKIIINFRH